MRRSSLFSAICGLPLLLGGGFVAHAQVALPAGVEESVLARSPFSTGLISSNAGGLSGDIWKDARSDDLVFLLKHAPARPEIPAIGDGLRRVLLTSATAPNDATTELDGAKLVALARLGFLDEARTIASLSSAPQSDPQVGQALATADLSEGKLDEACKRSDRLTTGRDDPFWVKLRVICYMAAGETDAADLTLELLRESGALDLHEQPLFEALVTGVDLKEPPEILTATDLAIRRLIKAPVLSSALAKADGGVIISIARDASVDFQLRLMAAVESVALGVMSRTEFSNLMKSVSFEPSEIASARAALSDGPTTVFNDAKVFQAIEQMQAPEFLRDKATLIAGALGAADTLPRAFALATLYRPEVQSLEGALLTPYEAGQFALANLAVGDAPAAARWLNMMAGGGLSSLEEDAAIRAITLINYLALLDPEGAELVASSANVAIKDPRTPGDASIDVNDEATARLFTSVLDAATDRIEGQAALSAIAISSADGLGNPLMRSIIDRSLKIAQLPDLAGRVRFETAWQNEFFGSPFDRAEESQTPRRNGTTNEQDGFGPRLKPSSSD